MNREKRIKNEQMQAKLDGDTQRIIKEEKEVQKLIEYTNRREHEELPNLQ